MEPRPPSQRPLFLTPKQAAPLLGMSEDAIREAVRAGELPGRKVMGRYRLLASALEELVPRPVAPPPATRRPWG